MSMLFFDGFDGYDQQSDLINFGGWDVSASSLLDVSSVTRSGTGKSMYTPNTSSTAMAKYLPNQSGKTLYLGFALRVEPTATSGHLFSFNNTYSVSDNTAQLTIYYNSSTKILSLFKGAVPGTTLATSSMPLIPATWYYVEVKYLCDAVSGIAELRINETVVASYTGNTRGQANDNIYTLNKGDNVVQSSDFEMIQCYIDDVYILNSDGAINNTYLGDVQCTLTYPSADYSTTFTPTGAVSNYLCVDDALGNPDDDTTYVSSSTVGAIDEYSLPNIVASEVHAVKVNTRAMKDDVNPRNMKHGIRTGTNANETEYVLGEGYGNYINVYDDQGDGTPWDETSFNAARSMIKVQS